MAFIEPTNVLLDKTYLYKGRFYHPGDETKMPKEFFNSLSRKRNYVSDEMMEKLNELAAPVDEKLVAEAKELGVKIEKPKAPVKKPTAKKETE